VRPSRAGLPDPHSEGDPLEAATESPRLLRSPRWIDAAAPDLDPPWKWSWFRCRERERRTFLWIVAIHAFAVAGAVLFPVPGWEVFVGALALTWLGGLGTTVGYHRGLAHRSVRLHRAVESALTFLAMFNGSGAPASWAANHRLHHAKADTAEDISSPGVGGFWWSHLRWLWQAEQGAVDRWAPDLDAPFYRFWTRWQGAVLAVSFLVGAPFGWAAFFWLGPVRLVFSLHAQCFVNSIAHMREGARPGEDSSQNIAWLGVLHFYQGENWHANHHAEPKSARIGRTAFQWDAGWWVILALERTGLARRVRRPRGAVAAPVTPVAPVAPAA